MKQPTPRQLARRKLLMLRDYFKTRSYTTHRGALDAYSRATETMSVEFPTIFRANEWSDGKFRLDIPVHVTASIA